MLRVSILAMLLATGAVSVAEAAPAEHAAFKPGTSSSGWIDFTTATNAGIYLPIKINGHETLAWLYGGPSVIDKDFAASIGLVDKTDAAGSTGPLTVEIGGLTLQNADVTPSPQPLQSFGKVISRPVGLMLGDDVFGLVAVDIDFARHRIAFLDPKSATKPAGAVEVPLIAQDGDRVVPLSLDGAAPAQFELEIGNVIGPLLVSPAYAQAHKLLDGHSTSQRLVRPLTETVVTLDELAFAGVDFPKVPIAIIPDANLPPPGIAGAVGLPLLSKFRLIIDASHNRLYALPDPAATKTPIDKDRIGLLLGRDDNAVLFVSPNSPAEAAGFKIGDKIAQIDGKPYGSWPYRAIIGFQMADAGTRHRFTMDDGTVRQVIAADFF